MTTRWIACAGCGSCWPEETSPVGYYQGAVYHGAIQLLLEPTGRKVNRRLRRQRQVPPDPCPRCPRAAANSSREIWLPVTLSLVSP